MRLEIVRTHWGNQQWAIAWLFLRCKKGTTITFASELVVAKWLRQRTSDSMIL